MTEFQKHNKSCQELILAEIDFVESGHYDVRNQNEKTEEFHHDKIDNNSNINMESKHQKYEQVNAMELEPEEELSQDLSGDVPKKSNLE